MDTRKRESAFSTPSSRAFLNSAYDSAAMLWSSSQSYAEFKNAREDGVLKADLHFAGIHPIPSTR